MIQNTNYRFIKDIESMKRFKSEIEEIKYQIETMGSRTNQCEDGISELEDDDSFKEQLLQHLKNNRI